jgi:hypothetical protein
MLNKNSIFDISDSSTTTKAASSKLSDQQWELIAQRKRTAENLRKAKRIREEKQKRSKK